MKYIVYLTTNTKSKINGINRIYVGVHQTENPEIFDGYIGCGVYVNKPSSYRNPHTVFQYAVKKYGTDAFIRTTLFVFDNKHDAYEKEKEIVNKDFISQSHVYNMIVGGIYQYPRNALYQFDENGKLVNTWDGLISASEFYGYSPKNFLSSIRNRILFLNCFWSYNEHIDVGNFKKEPFLKITYLYDKNGKLIEQFDSMTQCAKYIQYSTADVCRAIQYQKLIKDKYYVSYKLTDEFHPKPRIVFYKQKFYLYKESGEFVGEFVGKEIMPIIKMYSWDKMYNIFYRNKQWYKDFYISLEKIESVPKKKIGNGFIIDIYTKFGEYIETLKSAKEVREKYKISSSALKNIQYGDKYFENYIFKYHTQ